MLPTFGSFNYKNKSLIFGTFIEKFKIKFLSGMVILSIFAYQFIKLFYSDSSSPFFKPLRHSFQLYTNLTDIYSIGTIKELASDKNLLDITLNVQQWLIGNMFSGRNSFYIPNVDFDNGYFLAIFKYGLLGTFCLYLASILPIIPLFKKSKLSFILFLLFLLVHYKESTYFAGASYLSLFLIAKLEFMSQSLDEGN